MNERLGKEEKLKSKKLIDSLFSEGKSTAKYPIRLVYRELDQESSFPIQIAVSVSKRNFKKAVDRNHIKRFLREAYRKNKYLVQDATDRKFIFMFLYVGKDLKDFTTINIKMKKLIEKFIEQEIKPLS
ncbi:ribonuclease P protein component [Aquimarina rhabdastrellae]